MKIIVISHGDFAAGIVGSVQMLTGKQEKLLAYGLYPEEEREVLEGKLERELASTAEGEEVLVLSDIFHGSPFNAAVNLTRNHFFYHLTGINLPLLVEIIMDRMIGKNAASICEHVINDAPGTIKDVNKLLLEEDEEE